MKDHEDTKSYSRLKLKEVPKTSCNFSGGPKSFSVSIPNFIPLGKDHLFWLWEERFEGQAQLGSSHLDRRLFFESICRH